MLTAGAAIGQTRGRKLVSEKGYYQDPATEFPVLRYTDPSYSSFLPERYGRILSRRRRFLLFSSDRTGTLQGFRMDLKDGGWQQLTEATALERSSLTLLPDERSFCYFDGPVFRQSSLSSLRGREVYRIPEGWTLGKGFSVAGDGVHATFVEVREGMYRLRLVGIARGDAATVVESREPLADPQPRPRRAGLLYRRGAGALWLVNYDGEQNRPLRTAPGNCGPAWWSADGKTVLYLNFPEQKGLLNSIREHTPDANEDVLFAKTSQFVNFAPNGDESVFVGASGSKAAPYILIVRRATQREITFCEHDASDAAAVAPVFTPDSQEVFFQTDRHGKPAIYSMDVDKLVEKTESS